MPKSKEFINYEYRPFKALLVKFEFPIEIFAVCPSLPGKGIVGRLKCSKRSLSKNIENHRSQWPTWPKGRRQAATDSNNGRRNHTAKHQQDPPMSGHLHHVEEVNPKVLKGKRVYGHPKNRFCSPVVHINGSDCSFRFADAALNAGHWNCI